MSIRDDCDMKWSDVHELLSASFDIVGVLSIVAIVTVLILQSVGVLPRV